MANISKKKAAKSATKPAPKGKGKEKVVAKKAAKVPSPEPESDDEEIDDEEILEEGADSSDYDSDEDSENGGISERGMARLMELVGPEDLDESEIAQLGGSDEDEEDVDEEDDDEDDDEEIADESIVMDVADPDTLAVDELGSDLSVDEDAVPMRKVTMNNAPAMRILTDGIKMSHTPFIEHLIVQSKTILDVDPSDDLKRETAFYKLALDAVPEARKLCAKFDIPFSRPADYYAEMVKSDEHMERVRSKLVEEAQGIKKSEDAKRQRDLKKYGKQIQIEKLKAREQDKKAFADRVQGLKRKRKEGMELGDEDDFGVELDDGPSHTDKKGRGQAQGKGGKGGKDGKPKMPRSARDAKYSLGGSSRRAKQNDRDSTNDFGSEHRKTKAGKAKRPGKSRRASRRN